MKLNIINIISTYASTAAMQAGKAYKKLTSEKNFKDKLKEAFKQLSKPEINHSNCVHKSGSCDLDI